jgi:hypothetical protein
MYMLVRQLLITLTAIVALTMLPAVSSAQKDEAIESGKQALNGRTSFPFYDAQTDDVKRLDVKEKVDPTPSNADPNWTQTPVTGGGGAPRIGWGGMGILFQVLGLSLLTLIIGVLIVLLVKAFLQGEQTQSQGAKFIDTSSDVDRVEDLPFQLKKPTGDFLSEAQRLYEAGKYSDAIVYLFSYQLVALDKRHVIRLAKGKTNRQYLRETRSREPLKQLLQRTMISFEDVFFGHHELSRERFEESWQRLDEFHQQLERVEAVAA